MVKKRSDELAELLANPYAAIIIEYLLDEEKAEAKRGSRFTDIKEWVQKKQTVSEKHFSKIM